MPPALSYLPPEACLQGTRQGLPSTFCPYLLKTGGFGGSHEGAFLGPQEQRLFPELPERVPEGPPGFGPGKRHSPNDSTGPAGSWREISWQSWSIPRCPGLFEWSRNAECSGILDGYWSGLNSPWWGNLCSEGVLIWWCVASSGRGLELPAPLFYYLFIFLSPFFFFSSGSWILAVLFATGQNHWHKQTSTWEKQWYQ